MLTFRAVLGHEDCPGMDGRVRRRAAWESVTLMRARWYPRAMPKRSFDERLSEHLADTEHGGL
jgi:hypothetical protein